jgi:hypothetical protein
MKSSIINDHKQIRELKHNDWKHSDMYSQLFGGGILKYVANLGEAAALLKNREILMHSNTTHLLQRRTMFESRPCRPYQKEKVAESTEAKKEIYIVQLRSVAKQNVLLVWM